MSQVQTVHDVVNGKSGSRAEGREDAMDHDGVRGSDDRKKKEKLG